MEKNIENIVDFEILKIQKKLDGTFIIDNSGMPFQITDDYPCGQITTDKIREYIDNGGEHIDYAEPIVELSEKDKILQQISELEAQLTATDYKVIKSVESGLSLSDEFVAKRQSIRDEINILAIELNNIKVI